MSPRILVFGTGAVASCYAYLLSRKISSADLVCVCRSNYDVVKTQGITIDSNLWGNNLNCKPTVARSVAEAAQISQEPYDYIVVGTKVLYTTPSTAELIRPAITPTTTIVLLQNGIGIEEPFAALYPSNPILSCVVYLPTNQVSPGMVKHLEVELLHIGTYPADAPASHKSAAEAFSALLTSCSATIKLHDDVQFERWSKLLVNASWNPISALTRSRDVEFMKTSSAPEEEMVEYVRDVMLEISRIANACGYKEINEAKVDYQIGRAKVRDLPGIQPSMLTDAKVGSRMEVDAIVGNAVRIARKKGVETPFLRSLYLLASGLDGSFARASEEASKS